LKSVAEKPMLTN